VSLHEQIIVRIIRARAKNKVRQGPILWRPPKNGDHNDATVIGG
jgi:hypothetical protein